MVWMFCDRSQGVIKLVRAERKTINTQFPNEDSTKKGEEVFARNEAFL